MNRIGEKVSKRIRARRRNHMFLGGFSVLASLTASLVVFGLYTTYADSRPTWAAFSMLPLHPGWQEREAATNDIGVPFSIIVNGERWQLVKVNRFDDPNVLAQTYCRAKTIAYIPADDPYVLRESLMHEIFHAGACLHGGDAYWNSIEPNNEVHPGIYHLGEFMASFIRANPKFMNWMNAG